MASPYPTPIPVWALPLAGVLLLLLLGVVQLLRHRQKARRAAEAGEARHQAISQAAKAAAPMHVAAQIQAGWEPAPRVSLHGTAMQSVGAAGSAPPLIPQPQAGLPRTSTNVLVFISYSHDDALFATRLQGNLQAGGLDVWIDHSTLMPGTPDWEEAIREGIHSAQALIYVASPSGRASPYVRDELGVAHDAHIPVFPVWVSGEYWSAVAPLGLGHTQYVDARGDRYQTAISDLLSAITSLRHSR
jgi:hypothetical protein